jgi:hypothetical protein
MQKESRKDPRIVDVSLLMIIPNYKRASFRNEQCRRSVFREEATSANHKIIVAEWHIHDLRLQ